MEKNRSRTSIVKLKLAISKLLKMVSLKTKEEIALLREGGKKLAEIVAELSRLVKAGVTTLELENKAVELIEKVGGRPTFKNVKMPNDKRFPTAICASLNDEVVHAPAIPARVLKEGDVLKIDVGMEYPFVKGKRGLYTDMAVTVPVGQVDARVRELIDATRHSLELAIKEVKPGNDLNDIGRAIQRYAEGRGFSVVREMVGHGVGYDLHEDPQIPHYEITDNSLEIIKLKTGMVIAIEPMINMGDWRIRLMKDGYTYATSDGSLSAQFEHTIAVTEDGHLVITEL